MATRRAFILQHTRLQHPPHTPELQLYLAAEVMPLWRMTERETGETDLPPPFWAFAWTGGQALARYLLDRPAEVVGKWVLDLASGSGLCAIAALKAGATHALAADVDPFSAVPIALNAQANGVYVDITMSDVLDDEPPDADLILAGDVCYDRALAARMLAWLRAAHARGTRVLIGDPGRAYLPRESLVQLASYHVPTTRELEDGDVKQAGVFTFKASFPG
jgi:predicted nicotinamide N-methyase